MKSPTNPGRFKAEVNAGLRPGLSESDNAEISRLKKEVTELMSDRAVRDQVLGEEMERLHAELLA